MPQISRFFGIIISMYFNDHNPPHFHAQYGDDECLIEIAGLTVIEGKIPSRAFGMVIEWATLHKDELLANWEKAANLEPLAKILPLH
ncbi:MAG: DUF4160 domain-containing protein [Saprospiraceae bacterium]|nr:DUF4160 domain-containing protein [Saprospiraceae bacterium]